MSSKTAIPISKALCPIEDDVCPRAEALLLKLSFSSGVQHIWIVASLLSAVILLSSEIMECLYLGGELLPASRFSS